MKILKYKKKRNGQYEIELESGTSMVLYEEVILKYELLLKKSIDQKMLDEILQANYEYDVYYTALKSLKSRFKSTHDLKEFLLKREYPRESIDKAIDKLTLQGYLNDRSFAKAYLNNQMITTSKGPEKLRKELLAKGVSFDIISEELEVFTKEEQVEKITKVANRLIKSNRTRGGAVLKQKILNDLVQLGYDQGIVNEVINDLDFLDTSDIRKREYDKLYRKYSRKYSGRELELKIKEKLYQKGLYYED